MTNKWEVKLQEESKNKWKSEYLIDKIYINNIAAGALIELPSEMRESEAVEKISKGLRRLLQILWQSNLVRPVIGVIYPQNKLKLLKQLAWDDSMNRGDFSLREAKSASDAELLINTLLDDFLEVLRDENRSRQIDVEEILTLFENSDLKSMGQFEDQSEESLLDRLIEELKIAKNKSSIPKLNAVLDEWIKSKGLEL